MLTKRIIPCLDVDNGRVVKGTKFKNIVDAGDPVEVAKRYDEEGADEIVFLDITASHQRRKTMLDVVRKTAESVFIPLTVGGGIRNLKDIQTLLANGADKVSINTAAVETPDFIKKAAEKFGSQCIVVAIDAKRQKTGDRGQRSEDRGQSRIASVNCQPPTTNCQLPIATRLSFLTSHLKWEVYTYGGRRATGIDVVDWAKTVASLGAGEILLTSMDRDGTKDGYDIELTKAVTESICIPVIASGGAGTKRDFYDGFVKGKASACLAASLFHFKIVEISKLKKYLSKKKVVVRDGVQSGRENYRPA